MKRTHRDDLYCWSAFDNARNVDFNSYLWVTDTGNVAIDPLWLSEHDRDHVKALGGVAWIVVTNSDHLRGARELAAWTGASIAGPAGESQRFPVEAECWLNDGDLVAPSLVAIEMHGSKTPGELALLLEGRTLITGDLVRCHKAGTLTILPDAKLTDRDAAVASVSKLAGLAGIEAVLVGDGWPIFRDGAARLAELARRCEAGE